MERKIYLNLTVKAFEQGLAKRVSSRWLFCLKLHQLAPCGTTGVSVLTMYSHLLVFYTLWLWVVFQAPGIQLYVLQLNH